MSDDPTSKSEQQRAIDKCFGKVLVGGLGLGVAVELLIQKDSVTKIVVVEKEAEIIELVWGHLRLNDNCKIVWGDIYDYIKTTEHFDCCYLDIWSERKEGEANKLVKLAEKIATNVIWYSDNL